MSGGSYNYAYQRVEDFAESLASSSPERAAFKKLLVKVARAMHDIEWVDSCDMGRGDEIPAIMECVTPSDLQEVVLVRLSEAVREAQIILGRAGA